MANIVSCVNFAWIRANRGRILWKKGANLSLIRANRGRIWGKKGANLAKICTNRGRILRKKGANLAKIRINPLLICMLIRALMCFKFFKILFLPFALTKMRLQRPIYRRNAIIFQKFIAFAKMSAPHESTRQRRWVRCF